MAGCGLQAEHAPFLLSLKLGKVHAQEAYLTCYLSSFSSVRFSAHMRHSAISLPWSPLQLPSARQISRRIHVFY